MKTFEEAINILRADCPTADVVRESVSQLQDQALSHQGFLALRDTSVNLALIYSLVSGDDPAVTMNSAFTIGFTMGLAVGIEMEKGEVQIGG